LNGPVNLLVPRAGGRSHRGKRSASFRRLTGEEHEQGERLRSRGSGTARELGLTPLQGLANGEIEIACPACGDYLFVVLEEDASIATPNPDTNRTANTALVPASPAKLRACVMGGQQYE
jgi:hypothetical protein